MKSKTTPKATGSPLIPAVGYIRMSTDDQKDSPERQRGEIVDMAQRCGYQILRWYEDHGLTGTESKNRPEFQRMMKDAPKREFKAILVWEPSRFSREDFFDAAEHWKILKNGGVAIVSVTKGEMKLDDVSGQIMALIGQNESHNESRRIAERSLSGKVLKASKGVHFGPTPWGYDREFIDESGKVVKRAACWERFSCPSSWKTRLSPSSDPDVIKGLQFIFQSVIEGKSLRAIARELNQRKLKTARGNMFTILAIKRIIRNPIYIGVTRFGVNPEGKFARAEETIFTAEAHDALVSLSTFDTANGVLSSAYQSRSACCAAGTFLLSKVLVCGHCGRGMVGHRTNYECKGSMTGIAVCERPVSISAVAMEAMILRMLAEKVLCEENREKLCIALDRKSSEKGGASAESAQLMELQSKIARGEQNLALAESENFSAIAKLLDEWRGQVKKLNQRLQGERKTSAPNKSISKAGLTLHSPEALKALRENLHICDRQLLAMAIRQTVQRITIKREVMDVRFSGDIPIDPITGEVQFLPELCPDAFPFGDAELWPGRAYLEVAKYVNKARRPVRRGELAEALGINETAALKNATRAVRFGLIGFKKLGRAFVFEPLSPAKS